MGPGADLVARVEGPGRIVLEASTSILNRLQGAVRAGKAARSTPDEGCGAGTETDSLVGQLIAERAADPSLTRYDADPIRRPDDEPDAGVGSVSSDAPASDGRRQ